MTKADRERKKTEIYWARKFLIESRRDLAYWQERREAVEHRCAEKLEQLLRFSRKLYELGVGEEEEKDG
jgi:hypothetical protein